jgi:hypothetical protein
VTDRAESGHGRRLAFLLWLLPKAKPIAAGRVVRAISVRPGLSHEANFRRDVAFWLLLSAIPRPLRKHKKLRAHYYTQREVDAINAHARELGERYGHLITPEVRHDA